MNLMSGYKANVFWSGNWQGSYSGLKNPCNVWALWADCDAPLDSIEISLSTSVMK